jgi:amino acid transporter
LTGLAAAETVDPKKEIPKASKQVIYRILIFYGVNLLLIGLIVPSDSPLYSDGGSTSRHSPFVIAIKLAVCLSQLLELDQKLTNPKGNQSPTIDF